MMHPELFAKMLQILIPHIGSRHIFSPTEAIACAKKIGDIAIWRNVLVRPDIKPADAIRYCIEIDCTELWCDVLKRPDVKISVAIKHAERLDNFFVWESFLNRSDVDLTMVLKYADKLDNNNYAVLKIRKEANLKKALQYAKEINSWLSWKTVLTRSDMKPSEIIRYAKKLYSDLALNVWSEVLTCESIKPSDAIKYAEQYGGDCVWLWQYVLERPDIPASEAVRCAKKIGKNRVWKVVLARHDVQEYLKK